MTAATAEVTCQQYVLDSARGVLERARHPETAYPPRGRLKVTAAMAALDGALRPGRHEDENVAARYAGVTARRLIRVIEEQCGDEAAAFVRGEDEGES